MASAASLCFYGAALIHALTIPKHILVTYRHVYSAVDAIPPAQNVAFGKSVAKTSWDYAAGALGVYALLNFNWAQTGGPSTTLEKWMVVIMALTGARVGLQWFKIRHYTPLGVLWLAPTLSILGLWRSSL